MFAQAEAIGAGQRLAEMYPSLAFGIILAAAVIYAFKLVSDASDRRTDKIVERFDRAMDARDKELDALRAALEVRRDREH